MIDDGKEINPSTPEITKAPTPEITPPQEAPVSTEKVPSDTREKLQEVRDQLSELTQPEPVSTTTTTQHPELNGKFFSVEDYFKKGNTNKTGYAILGYEAMEPITFWKTIIKSALKYLPDRSSRHTMADIGCAYGYLLKHIAPEFDQTIGIDISATALEKAEAASPTSKLIESNLNQEPLPLENESLDMITMLDSIEHLDEPNKLLSEANRVLKTGGLGVISTPDVGNWLGRLIAKANGDPSHINLFAQKNLIAKLEENGFEVLEKRPFFPLGPIRIPIPANVEIVFKKK